MTDRKKRGTEPPPTAPIPTRVVAPEPSAPRRHPIGTPPGLGAGSVAVSGWLADRGIYPPQGRAWKIVVTLDTTAHSATRVFAEAIDTRFELTVQSDEWGYYFSHAGRASHVRVADMPRVDGQDDHGLVTGTPSLRRLGTLVRRIEQRYAIMLPRTNAVVDSTLPGVEPMVRAWVLTL